MSDTHCLICGEPWDIYGLSHGDVAAWEADMIHKGIGCPCCKGVKNGNEYVKPEDYVLMTCSDCEHKITIDQDDIHYDGNKKIFHNGHYKVHLDNLDEIYDYVEEYHGESIEPDVFVCNSCYRLYYDKCDECGKIFHIDDTYLFGMDEIYCDKCFLEHFTNCNSCGQDYRNEEVKQFEGSYYCEECLNEISFVCEICDTRTLKEDIIYGPDDEQCCSEACADACKEADL